MTRMYCLPPGTPPPADLTLQGLHSKHDVRQHAGHGKMHTCLWQKRAHNGSLHRIHSSIGHNLTQSLAAT